MQRAWDQGVVRILIPGTDLETSRQAVELAETDPRLFAAVGVHPGEAGSWDADTLPVLRRLCSHPRVVAVGEIGLDYYRDHAPRPRQIEVFEAQLALAADTGKPVIVHNREAFADVWPRLSSWQSALTAVQHPLARRPGVLHSFSGTLDEARCVLEQDFYLGITGPVTFHNAAERQHITAQLPLDHLLVETDAPYLTPHPFRGRRNEPAHVSLVATKIAELHAQPLTVVAQILLRNAERLFAWGALVE